MAEQKKNSFLTEFFYITLLLTASRPNDGTLNRYASTTSSQNSLNHFELFNQQRFDGPVQNYFMHDDIQSQHLNGYSHGQFFQTKSSLLLHETLAALDDINSLGRYGGNNLYFGNTHFTQYRSNLIAFPVSGFAPESTPTLNSPINENQLSNDVLDSLDPLDFNLELSNLSLEPWETLSNDPLVQTLNSPTSDLLRSAEEEDSSFDPPTPISNSLNDNDGLPASSTPILPTSIPIEDYLLDDIDDDLENIVGSSDVMLPILDQDVGDVNDLFSGLELLLSGDADATNYTSHQQQEWTQTPSTYYPTQNDSTNPEYPVYTDPSTQNYQLFDSNPASTIISTETLLPANSSVPYSNNNNFGAVLYSSLSSLNQENDQPQLDTAMSYNGNSLVQTSNHSFINPSNVNNTSTFQQQQQTNDSCCFFNNGYVDDFNLQGATYGHNSDLNTYTEYSHQQPTASSASTTPTSHHQMLNPNKFSTTNEDCCFDKNSDSAVSSMSSDRVHSLSDNDLIETSSESSTFNCENNANLTNSLDKTSAQKKYRLFGRNQQQQNILNQQKSLQQTQPHQHVVTAPTSSNVAGNSLEYYPDYSQVNYIYEYSQQQQQNSYYTNVVAHNHSYAQVVPPPSTTEYSENVAASSMESASSILSDSQNWVRTHQTSLSSVSESINDDCKSEVSSSILSTSSRQKKDKTKRENSSYQDRDYHINRDERRARALNLPISTYDIINLPIDEFNERLTKYELTEIQLSLIRDIRRRGKNKVAAQNCRKRKLDQIMGLQYEVGTMYTRKDQMESRYQQLLMLREMARDKYSKLYQFVLEASSSTKPFLELTSSPPDFPLKDENTEEIQISDNANNRYMVDLTNSTATTAATVLAPASITVVTAPTSQQQITVGNPYTNGKHHLNHHQNEPAFTNGNSNHQQK